MSELTDPRALIRIRHETRMRLLEVTGVADITPRMRRISLQGDLAGFASLGHADHIKAFFFPQDVEPKLAPIGERGPEFALSEKPQMRDYTPRYWDLAKGTLEPDFVLHGDGPASSWAAQATIGQKLLIGGPRGSLVVPTTFDWYLLVGDETALPALGRRIEELPQGAKIVAIIEVEDAWEEQRFQTQADLDLIYCHRNGQPAGTTDLLLEAVEKHTFPPGTAYTYVAGESAMSKRVRAHLTEQRGFHTEYVRAAGYWLLGVAAAKEPH
jgi:NADPH-dependent ferric siderophore reductase